MINWIKKTKYYILIFLVAEILVIAYFYNNLKEKEENYLQTKTEELKIAYSAIVNSYYMISKTIYNEIINKPEVIDIFKDAYISDEEKKDEIRKNLYNQLYPTYKNFEKINFVQLHFQLPDCSSFLRFHKPEKFGDNLAETRYIVKLANTKKINVTGFDIGSVYYGYRYVFPLFSNNNHIGSIEIGTTFNSIRKEMEKIFQKHFCFIMKKDIMERNLFPEEMEKYSVCNINSDYLIENKTLENQEISSSCNVNTEKIVDINKLVREKITENLNSDKDFAVYKKFKDEKIVLAFIPIKNYQGTKIAYIISYTIDPTISKFRNIFIEIIVFVSLLSLLIISFTFYFNNSKKTIKRNRDYLQSITDNITEGIVVLDVNHKIISINPAAEKFLGLFNHEVLFRNLNSVIDYRNSEGENIPPEKWLIFENLNYGLPYKAGAGFYITKDQKEIAVKLSGTPRYYENKLVGFLIVFQPVN